MAHRVVYTRPYDSEVEYLKSSRTQWIDTDIVPQQGDEVSIYFKQSSTKDHSVFGIAQVLTIFNNGSRTYYAYPPDQGDFGTSSDPLANTNWHTVTMSTSGVYIDETKATRVSGSTVSTSQTISLFARKSTSASTVAKLYYGYIKWFKYKRNSQLILDLIPVRVGSVGYMYDKVSGKLFGNAGTGNFILGQDVANPVPNIRRVFRFGNKRFIAVSND